MSEEQVVIEQSNPTNEDNTIDNAINKLYDDMKDVVVEEAQEEAVESDDVSEGEEESPDSEDVVFSFPENMPKELRDKLSEYDEDIQKANVDIFKKMQGSFTKKNQEFAEQKKFADNVAKEFENSGLNVNTTEGQQKIIGNYIAFEKLIAQNPKAAVKQLMEYARIKPEDIGIEAPTASSDDEYLTDEELNNRKQLETFQRRIDQLENEASSKKNQEQLNVVESFMNAKNEAGELLYPHFLAVKDEMGRMADYDKSLSINDLYKRAIRMDDDLYNKTLEAERAKYLRDTEAKRKVDVEKAKKMNGQSLKAGSPKTRINDVDALFDKIATEAGYS